MSEKIFELKQIGTIQREEDKVFVSIHEKYHKGLQQLENFSHALIYWWADRSDNDDKRSILDMVPPYGENPPRTGVFASRAEYRPNPIAVTIVRIIEIKGGEIEVNNIDAFSDSPVIDIKAYYPVTDRVKDASIPDWLVGWPDWYPDDGFGLN